MNAFSGYLQEYQDRDGEVVARFVSAVADPSPEELPVLKVRVSSASDAARMSVVLEALRGRDAWLYLYYEPGSPLQIETEFGDEYTIESSTMSVERLPYEPEDFARLAKLHHEDAVKQRQEVASRILVLARVREMIADQQVRVRTKAQGHAIGNTARTLYEQQLSYLERLLAAAEA
jgi:hypothetical protein